MATGLDDDPSDYDVSEGGWPLMKRPPCLITVHEHTNPLRRLLSTRFPTHPRLEGLFPHNVPESYTLDETQPGWAAGGHYHHAKNEVFRCVHGSLDVVLRWVDEEGRSCRVAVQLSRAQPSFLVIPAGIHHEVIMREAGSVLLVYSSTLYNDKHPDEVRALPQSYDEASSFEVALAG